MNIKIHFQCKVHIYMDAQILERGSWKWLEDEEEDVRSYWMTLRTGEDILI